jgi:uncharacterized protein involved in high-affinity Fe2+ transport
MKRAIWKNGADERREPMISGRTIAAGVLPLFVLFSMLSGGPVLAREVPIGEPKVVEEAGLEVVAVYLAPIEMEPAVYHGKPLYLPREKSDVHIEADIHALEGNRQGFGEDEWVPGLTVRFTLKHLETGKEQSGVLHPMVAADGPHYGANLKMMGLGDYTLTYVVEPPGRVSSAAAVTQGFGRAAGVAPWWKPFRVEWTFKYLGPVKAGY